MYSFRKQVMWRGKLLRLVMMAGRVISGLLQHISVQLAVLLQLLQLLQLLLRL
jgi:hypothetical protein